MTERFLSEIDLSPFKKVFASKPSVPRFAAGGGDTDILLTLRRFRTCRSREQHTQSSSKMTDSVSQAADGSRAIPIEERIREMQLPQMDPCCRMWDPSAVLQFALCNTTVQRFIMLGSYYALICASLAIGSQAFIGMGTLPGMAGLRTSRALDADVCAVPCWRDSSALSMTVSDRESTRVRTAWLHTLLLQ